MKKSKSISKKKSQPELNGYISKRHKTWGITEDTGDWFSGKEKDQSFLSKNYPSDVKFDINENGEACNILLMKPMKKNPESKSQPELNGYISKRHKTWGITEDTGDWFSGKEKDQSFLSKNYPSDVKFDINENGEACNILLMKPMKKNPESKSQPELNGYISKRHKTWGITEDTGDWFSGKEKDQIFLSKNNLSDVRFDINENNEACNILLLKPMKKNPKSSEKHKVSWLKEPLSEEDFKTLTDYYSNKFVSAKIRWFNENSGDGVVRLDEGPLKDFSVVVHGSAFGGDRIFGQKTAFKATNNLPVLVKLILDYYYIQVHRMKEDKGLKKNPETKSGCIFKTPNQMRDFLNKHLKDRWHWKRNKIVVHTGQGNWKIARSVEDFFKMAGFTGVNSELDEKIGNIYVSAFVPRAIMQLHEKE